MAILGHFLNNAIDEGLNGFAIADEVIIVQNKNEVLCDVLVGIVDDGCDHRIIVQVILTEVCQS
ncbi:hypothetical protein SDC9_203554 [bioreactor metagenome]|uniref:Uncharacterized protein n=1 Tax=bioreactor metagenome TaxID=1076179 RepID=A0A645IYA8_9ZZZZ